MAAFTGKYEYLVPGRGAVQQGGCDVNFDEVTLTLVSGDAPLACDLGDIDVFEPGEYELRLILSGGTAIRLKQFGKAFQDLERQLLEAYRDRLVRCLLVSDLDEVARFAGRVHLDSSSRTCDGPAEIRLYESNVAVLPDAAPGFQWRLAEIDAVEFDERDYTVVLRRAGERLTVGRLAKRTGELADLVRQRRSLLDARSARVLHALFPFLSAEQFRAVAAGLREGGVASIGRLRPLHRLIEPSLLDRVVDGALRPYLRALVGQAASDWYAGFKIVRKDVEPEQGEDDLARGEAAEAADDPEDGEAGDRREPDPAVIEVGDGLEVLYWFLVPIGAAGAASHLAWEATSTGGRATYVFRLADGRPPTLEASVAAINRGLVALNFRREPVYLPADTLESEPRYRHYAIAARKVQELAETRKAFVGRAIHRSLPAWRSQLAKLLGD